MVTVSNFFKYAVKKTMVLLCLSTCMVASAYAADVNEIPANNYVLRNRIGSTFSDIIKLSNTWTTEIEAIVSKINSGEVVYGEGINSIRSILFTGNQSAVSSLFMNFSMSVMFSGTKEFIEVENSILEKLSDEIINVSDKDGLKLVVDIVKGITSTEEDDDGGFDDGGFDDEESEEDDTDYKIMYTELYKGFGRYSLTSHKFIKVLTSKAFKKSSQDGLLKNELREQTNSSFRSEAKIVVDGMPSDDMKMVMANSYISLNKYFVSYEIAAEVLSEILVVATESIPLPVPGDEHDPEFLETYLALIKTWIKNESPILNLSESNFKISKKAVNYMLDNHAERDFSEVLESVDYLNEVYHNKKFVFSVAKHNFVAGVNDKIDLMRKFSKVLSQRRHDFESLGNEALENLSPYTKLYIRKTFSDLSDDIKSALNIDFKGLDLPQDSTLSGKAYALYLLKVETYRQFMKESVITKNKNIENLYVSLRENLVLALNVAYNKNYAYKDFFSKDRKDLVINNEKKDKFWELPEEDFDHDVSNQTMVIKARDKSQNYNIVPGIYLVETNLEIKGFNTVTFHPLTMILAPEREVSIQSNIVSSLFIDTSALNAPAAPSTTSHYGYLNTLLPIKHSVGGAHGSLTTSVNYSGRGGSNSYWTRERSNANGSNGNNAGNIFVKAKVIKGDSPILFAIGGKGAKGSRGEQYSGTDGRSSTTINVMKKSCSVRRVVTGHVCVPKK